MKFYVGSGLKNFNNVNELSSVLTNMGWEHIFNWAANGLAENEMIEDLTSIYVVEQNTIESSDVVMILLPAGRGTHVKLGMSIALGKKTYLLSEDEKEFEIENTAGFYWHPNVVRVVGDIERLVSQVKEENTNKLSKK